VRQGPDLEEPSILKSTPHLQLQPPSHKHMQTSASHHSPHPAPNTPQAPDLEEPSILTSARGGVSVNPKH
jgi:hypothetical protein